MAKLNAAARKALPKADFAVPSRARDDRDEHASMSDPYETTPLICDVCGEPDHHDFGEFLAHLLEGRELQGRIIRRLENAGFGDDPLHLGSPRGYAAVPIREDIRHDIGCCASRGCHRVCSHLCGTDLHACSTRPPSRVGDSMPRPSVSRSGSIADLLVQFPAGGHVRREYEALREAWFAPRGTDHVTVIVDAVPSFQSSQP